MLFWALLASGPINMRKVDGWQTLATKPIDQPIGCARRGMKRNRCKDRWRLEADETEKGADKAFKAVLKPRKGK